MPNWFMILGTLLYLGGSAFEVVNGNRWLGFTYLMYALANIGLIMTGLRR